MSHRRILILIILLLSVSRLFATETIADIKKAASPSQIDSMRTLQALLPIGYEAPEPAAKFLPEVQCTARMVGDSYWAVDSWLAGDELYKVYQDVELLGNDCTYPFTVTHLVFEIEFLYPGTLWVQADIEVLDPDVSTENCPYPGYVLGITEDLVFFVPAGGSYLVIMPFDEPVVVDGPYFAGCYFGGPVYELGPALITDDDPYSCVSWNDWGEGYVDLISNPYFNFPGNLVMYSLGYTSETQTELTRVSFYSPSDSSAHSGQIQLCAAESADTLAYWSCKFEYYFAGGWNLIGEDTTPDVTLRNSISPATINPGFAANWNMTGLAESWYSVRTLLYTTADTYTADTIDIYVDNTPLKPLLIHPIDGDAVCDTSTVIATIQDEDVTFVQFEVRESSNTIAMPMPLLDQQMYGDVDGDTLDGNHSYQAEFGEFFNGPTAVTSILSYFATQGYTDVMKSSGYSLTIRQMVETIADSSRTRLRMGSQDDNLFESLRSHLKTNGHLFRVDLLDDLDLNELLHFTAYRNGAVLLGISQPFGHWLGLRSFTMPSATDGSVDCMLYDTRGGTEVASSIGFSPSLQVDYLGSMRIVDRVAAIYPRADTTYREVIGGDFNAADGWSFFWDASSKPEGSYMLAAVGIDITGHVGQGTAWIELKCESPWVPGDANGSGGIDIDDVVYTIAYIFTGGPAPMPEFLVADTDCSGFVDIDDVVYLIAYIFTGGPPPCN